MSIFIITQVDLSIFVGSKCDWKTDKSIFVLLNRLMMNKEAGIKISETIQMCKRFNR
jgi:phosphoribosylcarboxyaminoimidazole (NCAIR) mutase